MPSADSSHHLKPSRCVDLFTRHRSCIPSTHHQQQQLLSAHVMSGATTSTLAATAAAAAAAISQPLTHSPCCLLLLQLPSLTTLGLDRVFARDLTPLSAAVRLSCLQLSYDCWAIMGVTFPQHLPALRKLRLMAALQVRSGSPAPSVTTLMLPAQHVRQQMCCDTKERTGWGAVEWVIACPLLSLSPSLISLCVC